MPNVTPLKLVAGQIAQFQAGDTISSTIAPGTGGGGVVITAVSVALPYSSNRQVVVVTDATVTATSKIICSLGSMLDTDVNGDDDVDLLAISTVPASGSFQVRMNFLTPIGGLLKLNYITG